MILAHETLDLYGKMVFEKAVIKPPFSVTNPMPNEACFLYILKGETHAVSELELLHASERDAILMKCGQFLSQMFSKDGQDTYEAMAVHFYPEVLERVFSKDPPAFLTNPQPPAAHAMVKVKTDELLQKYFDSVLFYFKNRELVSEELMELKLKELFLLLEKTSKAAVMREILGSLFSPREYDFKEIIEAHVFDNLSLEQLASLAGLSLSTFKREFKKIYGESPAKHIRNRKLDRAAELLRISGHQVSEIAFQCGFSDLASFSSAFRNRFDKSPSDYRQPDRA